MATPPQAPAEDRAPSAENRRRGTLYWTQSQSDLAEAKARHRSGGHLESSHFSLQAAINALVAVCQLHGHSRPPSHSPVQLAAKCAEVDADFGAEAIVAACADLEATQQLNPFDADPDPAQLKATADEALAQCGLVCQSVRRHLQAQGLLPRGWFR